MKRTLATAFICLLLAAPAWAGFDEGLAAWKRGDYATALREIRPLAEQGHAKAQWGLGVLYDNGYGVPQDHAAAVKWYRKAAEQGVVEAQYNLGLMYAKSQGVPQNYVQAHKWASLAATQGVKDAQKIRDSVAALMPPADVSKAQKLARQWWAKHKKGK